MLFDDEAHATQHAVPQVLIQPDLFLPAQKALIGKLLGQQNGFGVCPDPAAQKETDECMPLLLR